MPGIKSQPGRYAPISPSDDPMGDLSHEPAIVGDVRKNDDGRIRIDFELNDKKYKRTSKRDTLVNRVPEADNGLDEPLELTAQWDDDAPHGIRFNMTKRDKRTIKHNLILNRVREGAIEKAGTGKKSRRPAKKLKTDIASLEDALPDLEDDGDEWEGFDEDMNMTGEGGMGTRTRSKKQRGGQGKMEMKSLKHKPGAMKKKAEMEGREKERFGKNLAGLMGGGGDDGSEGGDKRWEALRGFIGETMEKDKAFK